MGNLQRQHLYKLRCLSYYCIVCFSFQNKIICQEGRHTYQEPQKVKVGDSQALFRGQVEAIC